MQKALGRGYNTDMAIHHTWKGSGMLDAKVLLRQLGTYD